MAPPWVRRWMDGKFIFKEFCRWSLFSRSLHQISQFHELLEYISQGSTTAAALIAQTGVCVSKTDVSSCYLTYWHSVGPDLLQLLLPHMSWNRRGDAADLCIQPGDLSGLHPGLLSHTHRPTQTHTHPKQELSVSVHADCKLHTHASWTITKAAANSCDLISLVSSPQSVM